MIVTAFVDPSRTGEVAWRCLARRGMVHSECEAVDLVSLPPGSTFAPPGRDGVESAWFVVRGSGSADGLPVRTGDVVLAATPTRLAAGSAGLDVLWVAVLPAAVSALLPRRSPVAP
ncbi:hypothetical protein GCM10022243_14450 [Saccharothrix violaceirubra]|uniref:Uncharacterized protein n=1 Tax=Saccharothrix violaceirubra TaxID=413306 RepID=A0A7W7T8N1_9PSEU|nr:cupin domain-containing protein [Saccharothrix violaceirubra]MBB4967320.1 hypothetical protein [Saccharothrix violaceirubra]